MVRLGSQGWELHRGPACADCTPFPNLRDAFWAREFLRQFKSDSAAIYEFRQMVLPAVTWWPLRLATTEQVMGWMARLLELGEWHVHAPVLPDTDGAAGGGGSEETDLAEIVSALAAVVEPAERPAPSLVEGSLPRDADEQAIAESMKNASALGVPFCEECAREAQKRAREAAIA
jgi:hypothetical protein